MPRLEETAPDRALSRSDDTLVRLADFILSLFFGQLHRYFAHFFILKPIVRQRTGTRHHALTREEAGCPRNYSQCGSEGSPATLSSSFRLYGCAPALGRGSPPALVLLFM
jgi:hypothetical protein